ncbi:MAG: hypothetical protein AUK44_05500 [Porphyromonadaceae bacterium CG2_30_38_12]|nr:MAG: hypothetical protein AUK44_05500 [Porphyromonadaceae bacterium CG2_30_38_12]
MGANATTIGQGDVTGKIYRSFLLANTPYTFGNQFTNFNYTVAPDNVNLTVTIGTAYGQATVWGDVNSVKRSYEMVPTGGDGGRVAMNLHYLESELNGATEQSLVTGDFDCGPDGAPLGDEHGRSSYDFTNNYIGLSGVPMDYFQYNITSHNWRTIFILHNYYTGHTTWDGSTSSSWYEDTNWSNGVPGTAMTAIISDSATTLNDPILPSDNITIGGMQILAGGFLNMNGKTLTIAGYNFNGWEDQSGKSNYSGSTVVLKNNEIVNALKTTIPISGIPHFDTLTINTDAVVTATLNAHIYIAGTFTNNGTFNASGFENTIEYNGGNAQTVISPLNNSYYHLSFSGLGTKILPASAVNILGNLDLSAPITATSNTIVFNGTSAQTISGSSTSALNKITLNNASGLILDKNQAVNDTITFTNGLISTSGSNTLTLGCNAGTLGDSTSRYVNGKLAREYCGIESKFFPIGKGGNYRPLTIARTSGATGTSIIQSEQFESTIAGVLPANTTAFADRFWRISQPTGSQTYTIQINGTGFTPAGTAVILKGNETFEYTLSSLVATTPEYTTAVGVTDFGDFTLGSECLPPTITSHPVANATCELNGTAQFSVSASGTLTYQWQVSTSGTGGTYADISNDAIYSNATTDTLTITNPPLNINGYAYHVVVTSDCGGSSTSNGAVLTVNPQPQGSLSANSICKAEEGFLTWTATAGGTGPFTVIYSNGTVNDTVTNVNSNEPFSVGMHTADKTYTLVSVSNVTCTRTTGFTQGSATVTVNPYISWSGVTSTDWNTASNWCGGIPTSNDNVLIPNAPLNQPIISTSDDGLCNSIIIENGASVTVSTADSLKVSGNMTNAGTISLGVGVLTIAQNTIIENVGLIETKNTTAQPLPISNSLGNSGTVKFSGSAAQTLYTGTFNDIIIDNTAGVTLPPNAVANAQGTLQINSGKLEIGAGRTVLAQNVVNTVGAIGIVIKTAADAPGGSFIFHNAPENPVQAKVDMYSMAYWTWSGSTPTNLKWQFWGIPVRSATVDLNLFYGSYIRKHNEAGWYAGTQPTNLWFYMTQNEPIENIIGYELAQASAKYYNFSGELFNEDIYKVLDYTATGQYPGQHVLSNPYTCGIDIQQIVFGDSAVSEVYLYNSGSYSDWNTATKIGSSPGQYTVSTPATAGAEGIPRTIAPMQGFVVKAIKSSPKATIYIPYATAAITNTERIRAKKADDRVYTVIDVAGSRYSDRMWLFTNPTLTRDYDRSWDGKKINGSSLTPQIFGIENNVNLQIDAVDNVDNTVLGFRKGEDSNYNIKFTHFNIESAYPQLYLFDIQENRMIDISLSETTYNFTASNTTNAPRFKILTSAGVSTEQKKLQVNFTVKYAGNELYIENKTNQAGSLSMYGSNGVEIANYKFASQGITVLKPTFMAGAYIYKTLFENGKTTVGKFIIK